MRVAQVVDGIVVNVIEVDPSNIPDFALAWPEVGNAGKGWTYDGSVFTAPEPVIVPIYATAAAAKSAMTAWINALTGTIQNQYPEVVQKGWEDEEAMAIAFFADTMTVQQEFTLGKDAEAKSRTSEQHATRILEKAAQFRGIAEQTRRLWLAVDNQIDAVTDPMQYEAILDAAQVQAAPLAAAYGLT